MNIERPTGLIILAHWMYEEKQITEQEILTSIPKEWLSLPRKIIPVVPRKIRYGEVEHLSWQELKARQKELFQEEILPTLSSNPDHEILYFGSVPIPMAIHLGFLLTNWRKILVYLYHHDRKDWAWAEKSHDLQIQESGIPKDRFGGTGEVVLAVGTRFNIEVDLCREVVPDPVKEVFINPQSPHADPFASADEVIAIADRVLKALDAISTCLPEVNAIHLFAAIPVGLALLVGQKISPNSHHSVYTYEFKSDRTPKYQEAFNVLSNPDLGIVLDDGDRERIHALRKGIAAHFEGPVKASITNWSEQQLVGRPWHAVLFPNEDTNFLSALYWSNLGGVWETSLVDERIEEDSPNQKTDRFYDISGTWNLRDTFLHPLHNELEDEVEVFRAIRLFLFHESIHYRFHDLKSAISTGMGLFPRVLEEADYQADVIALLHEFKFSCLHDHQATAEVAKFFEKAIRTAIQTMWAFDLANDPRRMEVRRINRYLIWYFQLIRIREVGCKTFGDVLRILALKPVLDIRGLETQSTEGRVYALVKEYHRENLGIAILLENRFNRLGFDPHSMAINILLEGFLERDGNKIEQVMEQLLAQRP